MTKNTVSESKHAKSIDFSMWRAFLAQLRIEGLLNWRNKSDLFQSIVFFIIVISLFPIAINSSDELLSKVAPGVLWVCILLAVLFASERLFAEDVRDGSLQQQMLNTQPLTLFVLAKLLIHWLMMIVPMLLVLPIMAMMLSLPQMAWFELAAGLVCGSLSLIAIAALAAALSVSLGESSLLLALLVLPLYIPVLIFGSSAVQLSVEGFPAGTSLLVLVALSILALCLIPWLVAQALKISLSS